MRRQFSNSAVISTGRPARVKTQATSWSLVGPPRTFTRSDLRLTKCGTCRPLAVPSPAACAKDAGASSAATTSPSRMPCLENAICYRGKTAPRNPGARPNLQCRRIRLKRPERQEAFEDMPARKKPLVVVTRKLPDSVETRMRELFDTQLNLDDKPMSQAELVAAAK